MSDAARSASTWPRTEAAPVEAAPTRPVRVVRNGVAALDRIAVEVPVALRYNCRSHVVMMASPTDLVDFAYGFSLAEGIVADVGEIEAVATLRQGRGIRLAIQIPEPRASALDDRSRNLAGRTGCGLCGVAEIETALRRLPRVAPPPAALPVAAIDRAVRALPDLQPANRATGAVHAAAFADRTGSLLAVREDVGRHNALDKLIGALARANVDPRQGFVAVTSRCSMEMVQKTVTFGCPVLVAVSAPTALAVELAATAGLTIAAFARGEGCNLYTHPDAIAGG